MAMRGLVVVLFAIGCGSKPPAGPAWPAPSTTAEDGGESIEPRTTTVATALEASKDEEKERPADQPEIIAKPGAASTDTDETETPSMSEPMPSSDDVIMSEEIIIEIED